MQAEVLGPSCVSRCGLTLLALCLRTNSESAEIVELCDMIEVDVACQTEVLEDLQKSWALRESRSQARK